MRTAFTGVGTALVTPFTKNGDLDEAAVRRLGRRQIDGGVHFLVPCGTTGETPTLSAEERLRIVEIVVDEAHGRVPILAGAGGYDTKEVIHVAREMERLGVSGLLSVTPYYNKPTQEGLYQHFKAIAESTPLPIIVYNVPGRTGVNVEVATLARMAEVPNIVGVKEASGNMTQMCEVANAVPPDFLVLSGDDALTLPLMAVGGRGIISVASNEIPREMAEMVEAAERGDFAAARAIHSRILPLMQINFVEANPIPVKSAMAAMGLVEEIYRLPMVAPRPASKEKILKVLKELDLLKAALGVTLQDDDPAPGRRGRRSQPRRRARRVRAACARPVHRSGPRGRTRFPHRRPDGVSTPGSSRAFCSASSSAPRRSLDGSRQAAVLRQGHTAASQARARRRRSHRARRIRHSRRRLPGRRRDLHAADVREHRRLCRRRLDARLARPGRLVRAGRRARARQRRRADWRRHRAGRRAPGDR
jgi:4-hydroxy-tetrahydrodipicolinate synthase